ncbi:MAG: carbohydrate ABC transporter permease [Bacteroidales bacterium]|nr:carbohydrate ABC transporter permease [Bacteroidales bacterium]
MAKAAAQQKRKMETSEIVFKVIAYFVLIVFAIMCIYPLLYALAASLSGATPMQQGKVTIVALDIQVSAFRYVVSDTQFWINYSNTIFMAGVGTVWCLFYSILGGYALAKKRLMGRHGWNFVLVFTMWFSAGIVPQYLNYQSTASVLSAIGISDLKWTVILAMGMNAQNIILLRNSFEGVPQEIEEAARIDGATEMQVLWRVFIPMSKATIATVSLFFAISRWNGYFWAYKLMGSSGSNYQPYSWPVQVYIRDFIESQTNLVSGGDDLSEKTFVGMDTAQYGEGGYYGNGTLFTATSVMYAMVVAAIIPILVIYPFISKYFTAGVNMGGVKE